MEPETKKNDIKNWKKEKIFLKLEKRLIYIKSVKNVLLIKIFDCILDPEEKKSIKTDGKFFWKSHAGDTYEKEELVDFVG